MSLPMMIALLGAASGLTAVAMAWMRISPLETIREANRFRAIVVLGVIAVVVLALNISFETSVQTTSATKSDVTHAAAVGQAKLPKTIEAVAENNDIDQLKRYLNASTAEPKARMSKAPTLPDVDTMIESLAARLKANAGDIEGWRMLGWSYQNTKRPEEAVAAYQQALKLAPEREDLKRALKQAKAAAETSRSKGSLTDIDN